MYKCNVATDVIPLNLMSRNPCNHRNKVQTLTSLRSNHPCCKASSWVMLLHKVIFDCGSDVKLEFVCKELKGHPKLLSGYTVHHSITVGNIFTFFLQSQLFKQK